VAKVLRDDTGASQVEVSHGGAAAPNERLKLTGAAILVLRASTFSRRPRQLSLGVMRQRFFYA
jgi:hypothetical protein